MGEDSQNIGSVQAPTRRFNARNSAMAEGSLELAKSARQSLASEALLGKPEMPETILEEDEEEKPEPSGGLGPRTGALSNGKQESPTGPPRSAPASSGSNGVQGQGQTIDLMGKWEVWDTRESTDTTQVGSSATLRDREGTGASAPIDETHLLVAAPIDEAQALQMRLGEIFTHMDAFEDASTDDLVSDLTHDSLVLPPPKIDTERSYQELRPLNGGNVITREV